MDPSAPWLLLLAGLVLLGVAAGLHQRDAWLRGVLGAPPGQSLTAAERRLPLVLGLVGCAWIATFALLAFPYPHAVKPYWAVIAIVVLLPATPLAFIATGAWILLRRARRSTTA